MCTEWLIDFGERAIRSSIFKIALGGGISLASSVVVLRLNLRATRRAAGRALALEIWGNMTKLIALADLIRKAMSLRPELLTISRGTFDFQASLFSPLLRLAQLQTVTLRYIEAPGTLALYQASLLDHASQPGRPMPPDAYENIRDSAAHFLEAWCVLSPRVFTRKELATLENSREGRAIDSFRQFVASRLADIAPKPA
jgi:hypothetical protein